MKFIFEGAYIELKLNSSFVQRALQQGSVSETDARGREGRNGDNGLKASIAIFGPRKALKAACRQTHSRTVTLRVPGVVH
jgi:hypothetical protein